MSILLRRFLNLSCKVRGGSVREIPHALGIVTYGTILWMQAQKRTWTRSTALWGSTGISLRSCRIQPGILNTDSSALECISLCDSPSRSFSCRSHSLAYCMHLKDGFHYPSGHKIVILDTSPIQLMSFRSV